MKVQKNEIQLIYNPESIKDREALSYAASLQDHEVKEMDVTKETFTETQLADLADKLDVALEELIDTASDLYKETFKNQKPDRDGVLKTLRSQPALLKTPIVMYQNAAHFLDSSMDLIKEDMASSKRQSSESRTS